MIERRHLLTMAAALPAAAAFPKMAKAAFIDRSAIPMKPSGPVEVLYKTPTPKPNGMDVTSEGMWIIDQSPGNLCTLFNAANGQQIRQFAAEGALSASGICVDGNVAWIGSTYNRMIISVDARTGKLIQKYSTPGAGQIYRTRVDQAGRRSPLPQAAPAPPAS
jgi:outer membrane protein assembly factor BamB